MQNGYLLALLLDQQKSNIISVHENNYFVIYKNIIYISFYGSNKYLVFKKPSIKNILKIIF